MYMIKSYTYMNDPNEVRIKSIDRLSTLLLLSSKMNDPNKVII